ncbi:response regulator transcription factor, partial [Metabacillus fastidiosus]
MKILYIEDDIEIGEWVKKDLIARGFEVDWLTSGLELPKLDQIDLLVLDVMLPGLDGFSLGKRIKKNHPSIPIIMLSARTAIEDKLEGLEFADDYMTKPFHPEELAKRIEILLRRYNKTSSVINLNHLKIDFTKNTIINNETDEEIILTGKQYQIFTYFLRHLNQILTKEQLFEGVWDEPYI